MTDDATHADGAGAPAEDAASRGEELVAARREKVAALRARGVDPFPVGVAPPTHTLADVAATWGDLEAGAATGQHVRVAGRVVARRELGKLAFLVVREDGTDLQLFVRIEHLDPPSRQVVDDLDVGDWIVADGEVMASKRGELSVMPSTLVLIGKNLRPLPDKWHGLKDIEQRSRQREVDLVVTEETRRTFAVRAKVLRALRSEMEERGFIEVETPMLQPIPGGAAARPFVTHHNALDIDLYLRVAPELYLKRLMAGGMRRVYEINRNFRNEGISPRHNPEFTMLECYQAYADYHDMMDLTEALVRRAALEALGTLEVVYQGRPVDLSGPWPRRTVLELVTTATGRDDLGYDLPLHELRALASEHRIEVNDAWGPGKLVFELYEELVEHTIWDPVFVIDHPVETSPLARRHRTEDHVAERFEPVVTGRELGNAFSELTDPDDQRARFEAQVEARAAGDDEAMHVDESYLRAMEFGMPPMGGLGIGVDRLVMLLADVSHIREAILFPTLRPES